MHVGARSNAPTPLNFPPKTRECSVYIFPPHIYIFIIPAVSSYPTNYYRYLHRNHQIVRLILSLPAKLWGGSGVQGRTSSVLEASCAGGDASNETRIIIVQTGNEVDCQTHRCPSGTFKFIRRGELLNEGWVIERAGGEKIIWKCDYDPPDFPLKEIYFQRAIPRDLIFFHKQNDPIFPLFNLPEIPSSRRRRGGQAGIYFNSSAMVNSQVWWAT